MATTSTSDLTSASTGATTSSSSAASEGPVLSVISKRLRALRKKHNRILQMEDSLAQGKTLNKEQQEVLRSKSSVLVLIDELERLRAPLASALEEELAAVKTPPPVGEEHPPPSNAGRAAEVGDAVKDLLNLMYFGGLFDVKLQSEFTSLMLTRTHERGCCLTYDYVTDDATDLLGERDLDLISFLQGLMTSRPVNSSLSHQNALEKCIEHAKLWLAQSDQTFDPHSDVTYAALREKLNKIMSSDYFTATPQMKGPVEVAAAAAVGNFGSFQVSTPEPVMPVEVPVQVEGSVGQYQESEENAANDEEYEVVEDQSCLVQEFQDDVEPENPPEAVSVQTDQDQLQVDGEFHGNTDFKEQQQFHKTSQRGGRRGYPNRRGGRGFGRVGGFYQSNRGQYSDNYYPRSNNYNKRGGWGGGGGGNSYYNHSSSAQGSYDHANVGVTS